jgi:predicted ATPase
MRIARVEASELSDGTLRFLALAETGNANRAASSNATVKL